MYIHHLASHGEVEAGGDVRKPLQVVVCPSDLTHGLRGLALQIALDIAEQNDHPAVAAFLRPRTPVSNVFTQGTAPQAPQGMGALVGSAAADVAAAAARAGGEL